MTERNPQLIASDPEVSAFVTANAGSGKTRTLVDRVARLLLRGAQPEAILCLTYTKAAAAEMQRRLFDTLGAWAVMTDHDLAKRLEEIEEAPRDLSRARGLFAKALETPGGLKIQTIHAFCEKLLRRFPLEAGVSPGFQVLEDQAAREVSARAREDVARAALDDPDGLIGRAYARFSVELDYRSFHDMFAAFEARRAQIAAYVAACAGKEGVVTDIWRACGFEAASPSAELQASAVKATDFAALGRCGEALLGGSEKTDRPLGLRVLELVDSAATGEVAFEDLWALFSTKEGKARSSMATKQVAPWAGEHLMEEQRRLEAAGDQIKAARVAEDSIAALMLAAAYVELYVGAKEAHGALDFGDLIARTHELLTVRADAAWVLFKLDGGVDHVLVDEAQDTSPDQWDIVEPLTQEFFSGDGARGPGRTVFAVGDEKQSIFSFQGADPERFLREKLAYESLVRRGGGDFKAPSLLQSYRSAPEVLSFVDAVFDPPELRRAFSTDGAKVQHLATRPAGHGAVDLWPLEETEPSPETDPWAPVDVEPPESANKKLARRIAREIKAMVERGDAVFGHKEAARPMGFGDVLILVRRRNALFHEIIRALKRADVPVGGADRLALDEHIVFDDLIGLARICLYPDDDLTLAALLRSPLFDIDEDSLYVLAYGRGGSLWAELAKRAQERPEWQSALEVLRKARMEAARRPPFDFYARLLGEADAHGRSVRARILTRLGREAEQALDAFLSEALKAEARGVRDLECFAAEMAASEVEVKREQEDGKGEVRVMTVHGAKGLEAPVVILPDTATKATARGGPLLQTAAGGFLWCARKGEDCDASTAARDKRADDADRESLRLLYVALTRPRDKLIVCGVKPSRDADFQGSWRDHVDRALAHPDVAPRLRDQEGLDGLVMKRFGADPQRASPGSAAVALPQAAPGWLYGPAPPEPAALKYASPSRLAEAEHGPSPSPLARDGGLGRFRRGELIHRLLQLLPDVEPAGRRTAGAALLDRERDLSPQQRAEMLSAALGVLEDQRFAAVFGPGSRAEVAIAGSSPELPDGLAVSGRLDRLVVEKDRVLVADFKTNRPSPARIEEADKAYITQMAVYAAVLRAAFPGRRVEAALVWTDGPKLMAVPEKLVAQALEALPRSR
jgi:ATP-dependent helicase/nuclease subunit A